MKLTNSENGSVIEGEAAESVGRGKGFNERLIILFADGMYELICRDDTGPLPKPRVHLLAGGWVEDEA